MSERKVYTVWDGGQIVEIPPPMGKPRDDQMQGTLAEKVAEIACRVCFDDRTEVLSENGWVLFKDLPKGVCVATVNGASGRLEYEYPTDYIIDPYDGELYAVDNTKVSIRVTPDHRMVVVDKAGNLELRRAIECRGTKYTLRRSAARLWDDAVYHLDDTIIPPYKYTRDNPFGEGVQHRETPGISVPTDVNWARFLGYFISEGTLSFCQGTGPTVGVYQNPNGMAPIVEAMEECGFTVRVYDDPRKDMQEARVGSSVLARYLLQFGKGSLDRRLPHYVFEWPLEMREALLDALMYGDGTTSRNGVRVYNTASEGLADDVQRLMVEMGRNANINISRCETCIMYRVRETKHGDHTVNKHKIQDRMELYVGTVYCVSVPNQTLIVRRNKKVYVCGNCYDSLGAKRSRNSADNLKHITEVGHLSVLEHFHATFLLFITKPSRGPVIESLSQRPGVYFRVVTGAGPGAVRITMNARAMLEWDRWTEQTASGQAGYPQEMAYSIGMMLQGVWHDLAPVLIEPPPAIPTDSDLGALNIGSVHQVPPDHPSEVWITLYMEGSRGFSHELVRHGDYTAISQRSTRYVNEDESPWDWHPLIRAYISDPDTPFEALLTDTMTCCQATYRDIVEKLRPWLLEKIPEDDPYRKHTARKQARGAARGFLGNALRTAVIFSATATQWRHMMRMRAADAADAEIRMTFSEALPLLQAGAYGNMFEDLQLTAAGDGLGLSLVGGGVR